MKAISFTSIAQAIAFRYTGGMTIARKTVADADADVFAAIAHPIRRELLDQLAGGGRSVKALAAPFETTRQAISQHLRILLAAGLVEERRQGRERVYELQAQPLAEVEQWLARYRRFWRGRLGTLGSYLQEHQSEQRRDP
jgi:DNA-binding transcriptional ArsR family regulator